jgi:hypothetical protein
LILYWSHFFLNCVKAISKLKFPENERRGAGKQEKGKPVVMQIIG